MRAATSDLVARPDTGVRDFLFRHACELLENKEIIELGLGSGEVVTGLLGVSLTGKIRGYEIEPASYKCACQLIDANSTSISPHPTAISFSTAPW